MCVWGGGLLYIWSTVQAQYNWPIKISECTASLCSGEQRQGRLSFCKSCPEQAFLWKAAPFLFRKTESKCCRWRQEAFSMLNYFHYVFSDAYWFHSRKSERLQQPLAALHVPYISSSAETMAQYKHIFSLRSFRRDVYDPLIKSSTNKRTKWSNQNWKHFNYIKNLSNL